MLEACAESLQRVIHALRLRFREVAISLNLPCNVLKFCLELLFRLDPLHEHDVVIAVHLDELVVHCCQWHVLILLPQVTFHVFLGEFLFGCGDFGLHDGVAGGHESGRALFHHFDYLSDFSFKLL